MGLLSATDLQVITDRTVSRLKAVTTDVLGTMLAANMEEGVARYLDDATNDPDLQAALLSSLAVVDRQALTGNIGTYMQWAVQWPAGVALVQALDTYVRSAAGGSYASFAAYVSGVAATLHPLAAEMIRHKLGEAALTLSSATVGAMAPLQKLVPFERVYTGALGALVDDTADAASTTTADVDLFAANGDKVILQSRSKFSRFVIGCSTLSSANVLMSAKYWNGSAWATLSLTDTTTGLTVNGGLISFTLPTDWVPSNDDNAGSPARLNTAEEGEYYTVILERTEATVVTPPVAYWILCVPEPSLTAAGTLAGVDQPPIGLVRITGTNAATVTEVQNPSSRFLLPNATNNALIMRALTPIAQAVTFTIGYKDQAGAASTQAQSAWSGAKVPGDTANISLGADTGLSELTAATCTIATTATSGLFAIEVAAYRRAIGVK